MKKQNVYGFTLIELLAVITIMGILMFVGIPAISRIIFSSRKDVAETSVKRYTNEINKEIKSYEIANGEVNDGTYSIMKNGYVCLDTYDVDSDSCAGMMLEVEMEGQTPESGEVEIFNKKVVDVFNAKVNSFYVNDNDSDYVASTEPVEVSKTLCRATGDVSYESGTLYSCEVVDGVRYDFRILSVSGDTVNLMMTSNLAGVTSAWFDWRGDYGRNYNGCGPVRAYQALSNATSGWTNLKDVTFQYSSESIRIEFNEAKDSYSIYSNDPECAMYAGYYDSMKARMASYSEISSLSGDWYKEGTTGSGSVDASGYWLNDPLTLDIYAARAVGAPHGNAEEVMWVLGIRPVIQVLRSDLS